MANLEPATVSTGNGNGKRQQQNTAAESNQNLPATQPSNLPADLPEMDFGDDAGVGFEGLTAAEQTTPFLALLQALSPQCIRGKPEYNAEARPGMFLNTASQTLYDGDEGVEIISVYREQMFTIWRPREEGGGFRGVKAVDDPIVLQLQDKYGKFRALPWRNEEDEAVDMIQQFNLGILYGYPSISPASCHRAMLAFTSTKIGVYRNWMSRVVEIKYPNREGVLKLPPLFAHRWRLTSVPQSNKKGDFFNWNMRLAGENSVASLVPASTPLYQEAYEFHKQWLAGQVKVDYSASSGDAFDGGEIPM